jgi:glycine/D-amino acid oxidase-like deaminating enzyme
MFLYHENSPVTFKDDLPDAVDVVVIGGGIIGVSTAWYLLERGLSVFVCDKGRVNGEQSSRNWGWVRVTGRDPDEVPIAIDSLRCWEALAAELGDDLGLARQGILALTDNEKEFAAFESWLDVAAEYELDTRVFSKNEVRDYIDVPAGRWVGGIVTPSDCRAEPFTAVPAIARGLQARGGLVRENCAARTVEREGGKITEVATEHGTIRTQAVVCASGSWTTLFLSNLGIRLPQLSLRGTVARIEEAPAVYEGAAGLQDVFIRRRQDGGYTVAVPMAEHTVGPDSFRFLPKFIPSMSAGSDMHIRPGRDVTQQAFPKRRWGADDVTPFEKQRVLNPDPSRKALQKMREGLKKHAPQLGDIPFAEAWGGMIDATPDVVPVMDRVDACPGLFIATGFSGHGFGIGPGAGKVMADLVTGESPRFDLSRFRFSRFSDGSKMRPGPAI